MAESFLDQVDVSLREEYELLLAELKRSAKVTTVDNGDGTYTHTLSFVPDEPPPPPMAVTLINHNVVDTVA